MYWEEINRFRLNLNLDTPDWDFPNLQMLPPETRHSPPHEYDSPKYWKTINTNFDVPYKFIRNHIRNQLWKR